MTFLEALKTGRPMRRPISAHVFGPWIHLGVADRNVIAQHAQWRRIDTGEPFGVSRADYLAEDWQVALVAALEGIER